MNASRDQDGLINYRNDVISDQVDVIREQVDASPFACLDGGAWLTVRDGSYKSGPTFSVARLVSAADLKSYGGILEELIGAPCERSLAANSLKLRFGCERDPRGTHYIWIDPPWQFYGPKGLVAASIDHPDPDSPEYSDEWFEHWSAVFAPLDHITFTRYESLEDGTLVFHFGPEFRLILPPDDVEPDEDCWYEHWYATATDRAK